MKGKTGELLYFLLWSADKLARPTYRNLTDSFESWSYRNGLSLQLARLERQMLVERDPSCGDTRLYRLTSIGRLCALGGRDPVERWSRPWDGKWRLLAFDVPISRNSHRERLRRHLRGLGFGVLQGSVWVSPDLPPSELEFLKGGKIDVKSMIVFEARPSSGESDAEIVAGAWDFEAIHRKYESYLNLLSRRPQTALREEKEAKDLHCWAEEERQAWQEIAELDPFLPKPLLPPGYLGRKAWDVRVEVMCKARRQLRTFSTRRA